MDNFCSRDLDLTRWLSYTNLTRITSRYRFATRFAKMNFHTAWLSKVIECVHARVITSGHETKMAVTLFDQPLSKTHATRSLWLCVLRNRSYSRSKFYIAEIKIFDLCCSCDLDLDPVIFIYELNPYSLEIYWVCEYERPRQGFRKLSFDKQTDRTEVTRVVKYQGNFDA